MICPGNFRKGITAAVDFYPVQVKIRGNKQFHALNVADAIPAGGGKARFRYIRRAETDNLFELTRAGALSPPVFCDQGIL